MSPIFQLNIYLLLLIFSFVMMSSQSNAQNDKKVRISPKAAVIQTVGFTEVRIDYNRPGVKGRVTAIHVLWVELEYINPKTNLMEEIHVPTGYIMANVVRRIFIKDGYSGLMDPNDDYSKTPPYEQK